MYKNTADHPIDLDNGRTVGAGEVVKLDKPSQREQDLLTKVSSGTTPARPKSKDEEGS